MGNGGRLLHDKVSHRFQHQQDSQQSVARYQPHIDLLLCTTPFVLVILDIIPLKELIGGYVFKCFRVYGIAFIKGTAFWHRPNETSSEVPSETLRVQYLLEESHIGHSSSV